jgi:hypothetical protein
MQMDVYRLEAVLARVVAMDGMVQGAHYSEERVPGFHPGEKISRPRSTTSHGKPGRAGQALAGLCQVGGLAQDFVLRTASWAKISRPSGAIAKRLQDRHRKYNSGDLRRTPLARRYFCFRHNPGSVLTRLPTVEASGRLMERIDSRAGDPD